MLLPSGCCLPLSNRLAVELFPLVDRNQAADVIDDPESLGKGDGPGGLLLPLCGPVGRQCADGALGLVSISVALGRVLLQPGLIVDELPAGLSDDLIGLVLCETPVHVYQQIRAFDARLVIVDVLMAYLSSYVDSHKDQSVRALLSRMSDLAAASGAAILLVRHLNKAGPGRPSTEVVAQSGSSAPPEPATR